MLILPGSGSTRASISVALLRDLQLLADHLHALALIERNLGLTQIVDDLLENLRTRSIVVDPDEIDEIGLKDEGDRRMVEAAVSGGAKYVVTTDREFLSKRGYGETEFVTPREMLETLRL